MAYPGVFGEPEWSEQPGLESEDTIEYGSSVQFLPGHRIIPTNSTVDLTGGVSSPVMSRIYTGCLFGGSGYAEYGDLAEMNAPSAISTAFWVYSYGTHTDEQLAYCYGSAGDDVNYILIDSDGETAYYVANGGVSQNVTFDTDFTEVTGWHHLAAVFNAGVMSTYVDGVLKTSTDHSASFTALPDLSGESWLNGLNATVKIMYSKFYAQALSADQVRALYQTGDAGVDPAHSWDLVRDALDRGSASVLNHGTVVDAVFGTLTVPTAEDVDIADSAPLYIQPIQDSDGTRTGVERTLLFDRPQLSAVQRRWKDRLTQTLTE
jgi:hypothetical protein